MNRTTTRGSGVVVAVAALALCGAGPLRAEHALRVISASLDANGRYEAEIEFTEPHLEALRDDEAMVEMRVLDRDEHGGRHLLDELEDCRMSSDGSMGCPQGFVFHRVAGHPSRWRLAVAFRGRSPSETFRAPVTVRFTYSVSGGPETAHVGTIASCAPAGGGPTLICQRKGQGRAPASCLLRVREPVGAVARTIRRSHR